MTQPHQTTQSEGVKIVQSHAEYISAHQVSIADDIDAAISAARAEGERVGAERMREKCKEVIFVNTGHLSNMSILRVTDEIQRAIDALTPEAKPVATTPNGRTLADAIGETERLLMETFNGLDPDNEQNGWFVVRLTKIREALADRPSTPAREEP